ncbi:hypothetical protein V8E36_006237 [Tilletia maclaganii]
MSNAKCACARARLPALLRHLHAPYSADADAPSPEALWTDAAHAPPIRITDCSHLAAQCVRLSPNVPPHPSASKRQRRTWPARQTHARGEQGAAGEGGVVRRAVENAAAAQALEEARQSTTGLGLRVLNRQMIKNSR